MIVRWEADCLGHHKAQHVKVNMNKSGVYASGATRTSRAISNRGALKMLFMRCCDDGRYIFEVTSARKRAHRAQLSILGTNGSKLDMNMVVPIVAPTSAYHVAVKSL